MPEIVCVFGLCKQIFSYLRTSYNDPQVSTSVLVSPSSCVRHSKRMKNDKDNVLASTSYYQVLMYEPLSPIKYVSSFYSWQTVTWVNQVHLYLQVDSTKNQFWNPPLNEWTRYTRIPKTKFGTLFAPFLWPFKYSKINPNRYAGNNGERTISGHQNTSTNYWQQLPFAP